MAIKYHNSVLTDGDKIEYCLNVIEKLRYEHNVMGARYMASKLSLDDKKKYFDDNAKALDMTSDEKQAWEAEVDALGNISQSEWEEFKINFFKPKNSLVFDELSNLRRKLGKQGKYNINIDLNDLEQ